MVTFMGGTANMYALIKTDRTNTPLAGHPLHTYTTEWGESQERSGNLSHSEVSGKITLSNLLWLGYLIAITIDSTIPRISS